MVCPREDVLNTAVLQYLWQSHKPRFQSLKLVILSVSPFPAVSLLTAIRSHLCRGSAEGARSAAAADAGE